MIAWAQSFVSRSTSRTFKDTVDNNALKDYPTHMDSFQPERARTEFVRWYNPPSPGLEVKSDGKGSGGSGGAGFLIGAVLILLLALGLLLYFLLR